MVRLSVCVCSRTPGESLLISAESAADLEQQPVPRHDHQSVPLRQVGLPHQLPCVVLVLWTNTEKDKCQCKPGQGREGDKRTRRLQPPRERGGLFREVLLPPWRGRQPMGRLRRRKHLWLAEVSVRASVSGA